MADRGAIRRLDNNVDFIPEAVAGIYDIPVIKPTQYDEIGNWISFVQASGCKDRADTGVHFFVDDFQFTRLWTSKGKYLPMLQQFGAVMSPYFSLYTDFPVALQIYNHWRKHQLAAWMQAYGIRVYPTIGWSDERSYAWCFDGEPVGSTVCVSSVGTQLGRESRILFQKGYDRMMEVLEPETILFYGNIPKECKGNIISIPQFYMKLRGIRK